MRVHCYVYDAMPRRSTTLFARKMGSVEIAATLDHVVYWPSRVRGLSLQLIPQSSQKDGLGRSEVATKS